MYYQASCYWGDWSLIPLANPGKWCRAHMSQRSSHPTWGRGLGYLHTNFRVSVIEGCSREVCWVHRVVSAAWEKDPRQRDANTGRWNQPVCTDVGWVPTASTMPLKAKQNTHSSLSGPMSSNSTIAYSVS